MGESRIHGVARARNRATNRAIAQELLRIREDGGLSQGAVARAAQLSQSYLSEIESGDREPSLATLHTLATVLGCDLSVRLFPTSGPAIRDRFQARIVEALLRTIHPRWNVRLEVPVHRPVRGVIDVVLEEPATGTLVATEVHSDLRRVEQQLRWAHQKADALADARADALADARADALANALADARAGRFTDPDGDAQRDRAISRLLILRSTARTRALVGELAATFATEFPADPAAALASLTTSVSPWPGPSLLWAGVNGVHVTLFAQPRVRRRATQGSR